MSPRESGGGAGYARAVERRWSELLEAPVVLSPRDWARLEDWRRRGIPFAIVEEAMVAAARPERPRRRAPRLADVARLVEEAWSVVVDGRRVASAETHAPGAPPDPALLWHRRLSTEAPGSRLAALLSELLSRREAGEAPGAIDAELDRRLGDAVDPALAARVREELSVDLAAYRGRMAADRLERTLSRACVDRLRRLLELPRLASAPPEA